MLDRLWHSDGTGSGHDEHGLDRHNVLDGTFGCREHYSARCSFYPLSAAFPLKVRSPISP